MAVSSSQFGNVAVGVCCLVFAGIAIRRELQPEAPTASQNGQSHYVREWRSLRDEASRIGPPSAPIEIIEFLDFECPFCASLAERLDSVLTKYPDSVSLTLRHFPIRGHKFARPAAAAFECAKAQLRMAAMYRALFDDQDSIGLKPFGAMALHAGVEDTARLNKCLTTPEPAARIEADRAIGEALGVKGTPTVLVNGWLLPVPPNQAEFDKIIRAIRSTGSWAPGTGDTVTTKIAELAVQR